MPERPSIKGSALQSVVEDVRRLVDEGRLDLADLDDALSDKDRGILDSVVTPAGWYPMETYGRLLELLAREEGGADPTGYLCTRGARAAERLLAGAYGSFATEPGTWGVRVGQTMIGIGKLLYSFSKWSFRQVADDVFEIEVVEAREFPDVARYTAQGFVRWFAAAAAGRPMRVESERPRPDRVVYRVRPA